MEVKEMLLMLWETLTKRPHDTFDWVMIILMWLVTLFIFLSILFGIGYLVDKSWLPKYETEALISDKEFIPAHTTTSFITSGKVTVPVTHHHPDQWRVYVTIEGKEGGMYCSRQLYGQCTRGYNAYVVYSIGRISKQLYIKSIDPKQNQQQ